MTQVPTLAQILGLLPQLVILDDLPAAAIIYLSVIAISTNLLINDFPLHCFEDLFSF